MSTAGGGMIGLVLRRLALAIPTLLVVITLAFFMMRAAPGSPFESGRRLAPEIEREVQARYGFDRPLTEQYLAYLGGVLKGDLGPSLKYRDQSVAAIIADGFPKSLTIGALALAVALALGVTMGAGAAARPGGALDHTVMGFSIVGLCLPTFVSAPLLALLFCSVLGWLPSAGWNGGAIANLVLPVTVLALPQIAAVSRLTRSGMIESLQADFVRTARAKGLSEPRILFRHALKPALVPLVAYLGPACAALITGSLVVEQIFQLPGLGRAFVVGALQRDYTLVMGVIILEAALILALNLLADLMLAALDPRAAR
jgi:oligopeptide transport system permease protein